MKIRPIIEQFLEERTAPLEGRRIPSGKLYEAFCEWCKPLKIKAPSKRAFGLELTRQGFESARCGRHRYRAGIALLGDDASGDVSSFHDAYRAENPVLGSAPEGAPSHLSAAAGEWWLEAREKYQDIFESQDEMLLTAAAEAWDRAVQARMELNVAGCLTYRNQLGNHVVLPQVAVERDSKRLFAFLLEKLGLLVEGGPE